MPVSKGTAQWRGDIREGTGDFTAGDSLSGGYTYKSRFEDGAGGNPEQLIAAAHSACYSMALASALSKAGHTATSIRTEAQVTLQPVDGAPTITSIALSVRGEVPGLSAEEFQAHAEAAKAGCPVSRALAGVPEITLDAALG